MSSQDKATKDLLKFAITATGDTGEKKTTNEPHAPPQRDEEEKKFLKSAIEAYMASHKSQTDELIELIDVLKLHLPGQQAEEDKDLVSELLQVAGEMCENIDVACDLHKIGGFDNIIFKFLRVDEATIRGWSANVIGSCAQNNPYCQEKLLESGIMSELLGMTQDPEHFVALKAIFAVSCMIRQNELSTQKFVELKGFDFIAKCVAKKDAKLRMKSIFLLRSLCEVFKFCFPLVANTDVVASLCDVIMTPDDQGDLIDCALSLLLALSTHDRGVVDVILQTSPSMGTRLQEAADQYGEVWPDVARNSNFINHLLKRKQQEKQ